jgi:lipid A oxidase
MAEVALRRRGWFLRLPSRLETLIFKPVVDGALRATVAAMMIALPVSHVLMTASPDEPAVAAASGSTPAKERPARKGREILIAGYVSQPLYERSDLRLKRPNGTDVRLKSLGWDGDALKFPIDGGVRSVEWWGPAGFMVDFLHNKAVARLGKGAHGRKLANPIVDVVEAEGTIAGDPAPEKVTLTDLFDRLEFTHGHNVLIFTPLLRLGTWAMPIRPYIGAGGGFAVPHVEVWFTDDMQTKNQRTYEYQYVGPAVQGVVGVEFRYGRIGYFLEYKFSKAWVHALLSGAKSWKNFDLVGDLIRQVQRWWQGIEPQHGEIETTLGAHQVAAGAGYWVQVRKPVPAE